MSIKASKSTNVMTIILLVFIALTAFVGALSYMVGSDDSETTQTTTQSRRGPSPF